MPSVALQARENDAVGGDADEEEQSGRGDVDGGAVVVLQEVPSWTGRTRSWRLGFKCPKPLCRRSWLIEFARRSGSKLPGAELELADAQLASWAKVALVGWTGRQARCTGRLLRANCNDVGVGFRPPVVVLCGFLWSCCFMGAVGLHGGCGVHWVGPAAK